MEIMKLVPTGKDYLWGGTRLREEYGKKIDMTPLAETWECSVHPDGPSYIANGEFKGVALADVLKQHPEYIGTKVEDGKLPVLVKFIDVSYTTNIEHLKDNMDIFDFSLQPDEMELIDMMNINCRLRYDPDTVDFTKC